MHWVPPLQSLYLLVQIVNAADNPFSATELNNGGYMVAEGNCGEGKCGEGKCGDKEGRRQMR